MTFVSPKSLESDKPVKCVSQVQNFLLWACVMFRSHSDTFLSCCYDIFGPLPSRCPFLLVTSRNFGANPRTCIHIYPVSTCTSPVTSQTPRRHPFCHKSLIFERTDVPRPQSGTTDQYPAPNFQSAIDGLNLGLTFRTVRSEPVHGIHQHGDGKGLGLHTCENVEEEVSVNAQVIKSARACELGV